MISAQKNLGESHSISLYSFDPVSKKAAVANFHHFSDATFQNCVEKFQCDIFSPKTCKTLVVYLLAS